jgi:hypothetical protein
VSLSNGMWRSLVAHLHGVQGAGGSNPLIPTREWWPNWPGIAQLVGGDSLRHCIVGVRIPLPG